MANNSGGSAASTKPSRDAWAPELMRQMIGSHRGSGAPRGASNQWPRSTNKRCRSSVLRARPRALSGRARLPALRMRHPPGRTHPPLAQLQFPRFLRPDLTGVTRFDLSQVYRAPRRPVVMPVERWPRAARERFARPRAGAAPCSANRIASGMRPSMSKVSVRNIIGDECQERCRNNGDDFRAESMPDAPLKA